MHSELHPLPKVSQGPSWLHVRRPCAPQAKHSQWKRRPGPGEHRWALEGVGVCSGRGWEVRRGFPPTGLACGQVRAQCQPPRPVPYGLPVTVRVAEASGHPSSPAAPSPRARARVAADCYGSETGVGRRRGLAAGPAADWPLVAGAGCRRQSSGVGAWQVGSGRSACQGPR